jgi:hypothetical protein
LAKAKAVQKEGNFRADAPPSADTLYDLLGEIGTKRKSIQPHVLIDYPLLFRCPQIARHVRRDATDADRSHAAFSALKAAFLAIPSPTDRLVAEAILATGRFQGMPVDERKREVAKTKQIGCTENSYKHRRERVLREVCGFLLTESVGPIRSTASPENATDTPRKGAPLALAEVSADLHFRALAALFLIHIDNKLVEGRPYRESKWQAWSECSEHFLIAFAHLVANLYPLQEPSSKSERTAEKLSQLEVVLPPVAVDTFLSLYRSLIADGPPFRKHTADEFNAYVDGYFFINELKVYAEWNRWYGDPFRNIPAAGYSDSSPWTLQVERIAAKAARMERLISEHVNPEIAATVLPRRRAKKALAYYFDIDENLPIIHGRSLREWIDSFFDAMRSNLADDAF